MTPDPSAVVIVIAGRPVTPFARVGAVRIDDVLNDAPNTAALTLVYTTRIGPPESAPFAPHAFDAGAFNVADNRSPVLRPPPIDPGAPIQIYLGAVSSDRQVFGGQITTREQFAEFDQPDHVRFHVSCTDYTRRLNRRKVLATYGQDSATNIVGAVVTTFAPGISLNHVQPGLPTVDGGMAFTFEGVSRSLSRIAEKIGAYWYVDYLADLHFWIGSEAGADPAPIVPGADFADFKLTTDLTQVRTRVLVEGDGATVLATLPAGSATLPVSTAVPFNAAGGRGIVGTTRITYTGKQAGSATTNTVGIGSGGSAPPNAPPAPTAAAAAAGTAGKLAGGPYQYAVTFELADGSRSDPGARSSAAGGSATIAPATPPPPTFAAFFPPFAYPVKGPIAVGVTAQYAQTFVADDGAETQATLGGNTLTGRIVADPTAPITLSQTLSGGNIAPGYYQYAVTFLTPAGETLPALSQFLSATATLGTFSLNVPTANDARVVGRRIYRSTVTTSPIGPVVLPWLHVLDIPNNTATLYNDAAAETTLAARNIPAFSSATDVPEGAQVTINTSSDARVTRRRVYRKDGLGEYRMIAEIPNNTATLYNDVGDGPGGALAPTRNTITTGAISVTNIAIGPAGTVRRRLFRTSAGGSQLRELIALDDNSTTTVLDAEADSNLGGAPLPAQGGPGNDAPPTGEGATALHVADLTGFPTAGWASVESQLLQYTGVSTAGGLFLTGIPAAGVGAITASIPAGTVVTASPALLGVAPVLPVTLGDGVQLIAQVDDLPAQAVIAAAEGGDGVIEHYIQDRRLSETGARARGLAELALFKTAERILTYTTHDPNTRSGRTVHVDLPAPTSVVGDFLIQQVAIDDVSIAKNWQPKRAVRASTTRFSFDDVLNRLIMEST